jgi:hypothetical protein
MSETPDVKPSMTETLATIEHFFRSKASVREILDMDLIVLRQDITDTERARLVAELVRGTTTGSKTS